MSKMVNFKTLRKELRGVLCYKSLVFSLTYVALMNISS